ncbi:hypothetical protein LIA77_02676 [Sarocladium implicatum]|nr:hypothetical protein LIA77_02676 [Sarocladium implicatum]
MDADRPSHDSRLAMQHPEKNSHGTTTKSNGAMSRIPWRLTVQTSIISFSLAIVLLSVIPLKDLSTAGESYQSHLGLVAGTAVAPFLILLLNLVDQILRATRSSTTGIRPDWHFGLSIVAFLAALVAATMYSVPVAFEYEDKKSIFLNEDRDTCWDYSGSQRQPVGCKDGYWDREALWIVLIVMSIILLVLQSVMTFKFVMGEWKARKSAIKEQRRAEDQA